MGSQFLTVWFDLRSPSAWRRRVLDAAFDSHTGAMDMLLQDAERDIERIIADGAVPQRPGKYNAISVAQCLPAPSEIGASLASVVKDALVRDVAALIASHLELQKVQNGGSAAGFPSARMMTPDLQMEAARALALLADDLEREQELSADFMRRARMTHQPISYGRASDFALLYDDAGGRLFAWLPLLAASNEMIGEPLVLRGNLINIATGEPMKKRSRNSLLIPLEFGHGKRRQNWQFDKFLAAALNGNAAIKTAKLCRMRTDNESVLYRLYVSVAFETPPVHEAQTTIGVAPGVLMSAAWAMVDPASGRVLRRRQASDGMASIQHNVTRSVRRKQKRGRQVSALDYRGRQLDELLHNTANQIIAEALANQAQIVMREMDVRERPARLRVAWSKFETILEYKCAIAGVPLRRGMFGANARRICVQCGEMVEWNREAVNCAACGHIEPALTAEAINTARRIAYRAPEWKSKGGYLAFHKSFASPT